MKNKRNVKAIVLSFVLVAGMLLPANSFAQELGGGLFGRGDFFGSDEWFRSLLDEGAPDEIEGDITNDDFDEAPLGGGIAIMLVAGLGYVALKKKEDNQ